MTQTTGTSSLGEQYKPLSTEQLNDPYPFYARARQQEPIFFNATINSYVVTRMKDVRAILSDPVSFSSGNVMRPIGQFYPQTFGELQQGYLPSPAIINADGELHERQRAPLTRMLSAARVKSFESLIRERAYALVDAFLNDGHADLVHQFAHRLTVGTICELCGISEADTDLVAAGSDAALEMISTLDPEVQAQMARKLVEFTKMLGRYVVERRANPGSDFISEIVAALVPGDAPLTFEQEGEVVQYLSGLLLAAHDGTSDLIGDSIKLLLEHGQWDLLRQLPELIPNAVEELCRFSPPGYAFFRVATREVVVGDEADGTAFKLPAGTQFLLVYASANHDEAACPHAEQLDIQRPIKSKDHVGFGYGKHFCAGMPLGHKEVEVAIEALTQRIPAMRLVAGQSFERRKTLISRGLQHLEVEW